MTSADTPKSSSAYDDRLRPHSFDGIQEFDNHLPKWWLWSLYLTCIFSVGYWIHYEVLGSGASPHENYMAAVKAWEDEEARKLGPINDEVLEKFAAMESKVASGKATFVSKCAECHKTNGAGGIGPNLTDKFWLHGNKPTQWLKVIEEGVPDKGMAAWLGQLGKTKIADLVAYLITIRNTNVQGGKEPQGEAFDN